MKTAYHKTETERTKMTSNKVDQAIMELMGQSYLSAKTQSGQNSNPVLSGKIKTIDDEIAEYRRLVNDIFHLTEYEIAEKIDKHCRFCDALMVPHKRTFKEVLGRGRKTLVWPDRCEHCGKDQSIDLCKPDPAPDPARARRMALIRLGLTPKLQEKTFAAYLSRQGLPTDTWRESVEEYRDKFLANELGDCNWLILYGANGLGKTHLSCSLLLDCFDCGYKDIRFHVWPEFTDRVRATFSKYSEEEEEAVKREAMTPGLVVLDDIDKVGLSDWSKGILFLILNYRLNNDLPTILSFNWGPGDADKLAPGRLALEEYIGRASLDRVIERIWAQIEFTGESWRSGIDWATKKYNGE
jgi:DNA replication protein DnaC